MAKLEKRPGQTARNARHKKALFLPMDRGSIDQIALRFRMALEALRHGSGDVSAVRCLVQVTILADFLGEAGYGAMDHDILRRAEDGLARTLQRGKETADWTIGEPLVEDLTQVVNEHDRQLRETRLFAIVEATNRLERWIRSCKTEEDLFRRRSGGPPDDEIAHQSKAN